MCVCVHRSIQITLHLFLSGHLECFVCVCVCASYCYVFVCLSVVCMCVCACVCVCVGSQWIDG